MRKIRGPTTAMEVSDGPNFDVKIGVSAYTSVAREEDMICMVKKPKFLPYGGTIHATSATRFRLYCGTKGKILVVQACFYWYLAITAPWIFARLKNKSRT